MEEEIKVPRKWLERLLELKELRDNAKTERLKVDWENYLFGYIESVNYFLNK